MLFHNDLANTTEALPEILSTLKKKGFEFVPVSDLIYYESYHMDHTGKQICDVQTDTDALNAFIENAEKAAQAGNYDEIAASASEYMSDAEISEAMEHISEGDYVAAAEMLPDEVMSVIENYSGGEINTLINDTK